MATQPERAAPELTVYRPNQRHELGLVRTWAVMAANVWHARGLVWQLFKRDFLACYKKSFIGLAWLLLTPLVAIVAWVFLQQTGLLQPGDVGIPYPAYVLIGSTMWGLFMGFYKSATETLTSGQMIVMQVNFPHEALLFKQTAEHLANFLIALLLNIVVLLAFGVVPSPGIVLLPLVALPLFFLGAGIGLIVSMFSIVAVDLSRAAGLAMGLLMYLTPVIYSDKIAQPLVARIVKWNPLTYLVCSCRDVILYGRLYDAAGYAVCAALALLLFLVSWRLFYVGEHKIIERML
ncbi:MAG: ABC transporter permease [Kiritimatiellae bacterium]|nr:ABC transporter permease [Kiritimatiellia bacterium]